MIARTALAALLLTAGAAAASEQAGSSDFTCKLSQAATTYDSLKQLPPALAKALRDKVGTMADRGEPFNATDVISQPDAAGRRFIRAGQVGGRWFVWYEQGGIAYTKNIVVFADYTGRGLQQMAEDMTPWNTDLCARTDGILNRRVPY